MTAMCGVSVETYVCTCLCLKNTLNVQQYALAHTFICSILSICCKLFFWQLIEDGVSERGSIQSSLSLTLSQRGKATVGNMNYEMIRGCKMEINPGDYTAHYLTIRFLCQ